MSAFFFKRYLTNTEELAKRPEALDDVFIVVSLLGWWQKEAAVKNAWLLIVEISPEVTIENSTFFFFSNTTL